MSGSIDIDIGGTFTDCFAQLDDRVAWCKTRTTGFDLSRGMLQAIEEAAGPMSASRISSGGPTSSGTRRLLP